MRVPSRSSRYIRRLLWALLALVTVAALVLIVQYHVSRVTLTDTQRAAAQMQAQAAVAELNAVFTETAAIADRIALDLEQGKLPYPFGTIRIKSEVRKNPLVDGVAVTYQPFVYNPDTRLYQYYAYRQADSTVGILEGATYDYTQPPSVQPDAPNTRWYYNPLNFGAQWTEPFFASGAQKVLIEYGTSFYILNAEGERVTGGVVTVDYSLEGIQGLLDRLNLGDIGYGYITSKTGMFVAHPDRSLIGKKTIYDLTRPYRQIDISEKVLSALKGQASFLESIDPVSGEKLWTFFEPMASTGWVLGIVIYTNSFDVPILQTIRDQALLSLAISAVVLMVILLAVHVETGEQQRLWVASLSLAVLSLVNIIIIWVINSNFVGTSGVAITSEATANRYVANYVESAAENIPIYRIPTGIFVQALSFDGTHVAVNGVVYQLLRPDLPTDLIPGVSFTAANIEQATMEVLSEDDLPDGKLITWSFATVLAQSFDPSRFPFDVRDVTIRMASNEPGYHVVLDPWLETYTNIAPTTLPGVDQDVYITNWTMKNSTFRYILARYNSTYGYDAWREQPTIPELQFSIRMNRTIIGPFIAYILPGMVAMGLLFAFLLYDRTPGDKQELITALNYTAAIFFVIAIIHSSLRDSIAATGITYMEYLYILLYVSVVAVSADTFVFVKAPTANDGYSFVPKLLYLPLMGLALLGVTLAMFVFSR